MRLSHVLLGTAVIASSLVGSHTFAAVPGEEKIDLDLITKLRDEAMNHSKAQEILGVLTDEIGPRLTGSPALHKAGDWTRSKLGEWGLQNIHSENFGPFGRGWTLKGQPCAW